MTEPNEAPAKRLLSLDAFRGLDIVLMFLVNTAGRDEAFASWFPHRGWNDGKMGNGLADFVFPWFLFIVGCAIPLSMSSGRGRARPGWLRVAMGFRRGVTLYLLGTVLWCATIAYSDKTPITWEVLKHWDILPLIGFAYFAAVVMELCPMWLRVGAILSILALKWASLTAMVHPEVGQIVWEERRSFDHHLKSQLGWWGVMVTQGLPSAATAMLGALATHVLRSPRWPAGKASAVLAGCGLLMAGLASLWHLSRNLPFSKDFLTSSYVLYMAGTAALVLAAIHYAVDVRGWTRLTPLRVMGMNAIAIYFAAELIWKMVLMRWNVATPGGGASVAFVSAKAWLQSGLGRTGGSWAVVACYILAYWLLAHALYRKQLFFKV